MKVQLIPINKITESDGNLCVVETSKEIPFEVKRVFWIQNVPENGVRGNHANRVSDYIYICLQGSVFVHTDDGYEKKDFYLKGSDRGLYLPKATWMQIQNFSKDALLLVLASKPYKKEDYYNNYEIFLREKRT